MADAHRIDRATLARLAAHERWARVPDRAAATAAARQAAADRFRRQARELHPDADDELIAKVADNLRSAHAIRAALARWSQKRAPAPDKASALEDGNGTATPRRRAA